MSSHHFVKEMQEPALLIADGEPCKLAILEQLLEWSPVVVVLDEAFEKVSKLGIKVDYWLGDFDDINPQEILSASGQDHVKIVEAPDQNKTDLEKGIELLLDKGADAINIVWATGRRQDHSIGNFSSLVKYSSQARLVMYDNWTKAYLLPKSFSKWFLKGSILSLMPFPKAEGIVTEGLKYPLKGEDLEMGKRLGTCNEADNDGEVKIEYKSGTLLLIEAQD